MRTYSDNKYVYSVDMMLVYVNHAHLPVTKIKVKDLADTLTYDGWGDPSKNIKYSANDVIANPSNYPDEYKKVVQANLNKYPIILSYDNYIVDGVHRIAKATIQKKKKTIKAYHLNKDIMKKFRLFKKVPGVWTKVDKLTEYDLLELYHKHFGAKPKK
jgi:hypothetical protein